MLASFNNWLSIFTLAYLYSRVENCLEQLVYEFNSELQNFTVPNHPCDLELTDPDNDPVQFRNVDKEDIQKDIKNKLECLKWSYIKQHADEEEDCADDKCDKKACRSMRFNPVFVAKNRIGNDFNTFWWIFETVGYPYFDYEIPAILPSQESRLKRANIFGLFSISLSKYGNFLIDYAVLRGKNFSIVHTFNNHWYC